MYAALQYLYRDTFYWTVRSNADFNIKYWKLYKVTDARDICVNL